MSGLSHAKEYGLLRRPMRHLTLLPEPTAPGERPIVAGSFWTDRDAKPGKLIRHLRVKFVNGSDVEVCPANFVDDAWPWMGRIITMAALRRDWK